MHFVGRVDGYLFSEALDTESTMVPGGRAKPLLTERTPPLFKRNLERAAKSWRLVHQRKRRSVGSS
jgi:hypothetical protein